MPEVRRQGPVRRQLRILRRRLRADRPEEPYSAVSGAKPELRNSTISSSSPTRAAKPSCASTPATTAYCKPKPPTRCRNGWARRAKQADRLGHFARRPYFGFEIPDAPGQVLLRLARCADRLHGFVQEPVRQTGLGFRRIFKPGFADRAVPLHRQDILYFHALFWPAELQHAGFRTPTKIFAHGFLTVDGAKMSKSRGTFITAESYLNTGLNPEWLRYYFAAKLSATMEDIDLNLEDFVARVNSDLVGKYVNIASRSAGFIAKRSTANWPRRPTCRRSRPFRKPPAHRRAYEAREFAKAMREIMALTDRANRTSIASRSPGNSPSRKAKKRRTARRLRQRAQPLPPAHRAAQAHPAGRRRQGGKVPEHRAAGLERHADACSPPATPSMPTAT